MSPALPRRVGLIGAGWISTLHMDGMKSHADRATPVALCDPDPELLVRRAADYGVPRTYPSAEAMIAAGGIDVAVVGTPTPIRYDVVAPLLRAGIPVLIEKPLSETYGEAARIAALSRELGIPAAVNQSFRRGHAIAVARDILRSGECGRPLHLTQVVKFLRSDKGWRLSRTRYVMAIMSIHWFDAYRWLLGEEPETVYCQGVKSPLSAGREDTAVSLILSFPGGAVACLSESFSSLCHTDVFSIDCEKKSLKIAGNAVTVMGPDKETRDVPNPFNNASSSWYLLDNLLTAWEQGNEPETSVQDNLKTMRILEAAYRSIAEKRLVRLTEIA